MYRAQQHTLRHRIDIEGIGLHSGMPVKMALIPARPNTGIVFVRTDINPVVVVPAKADNVVDTSLATRLGILDGDGGLVRLGTVEHLMAAIHGLGLDNLRIEVEGPEVPVMDGSAAPFVRLMLETGFRVQQDFKKILVVKREVEVREGDKLAKLSPARNLRVSCTVDFDHPLISDQHLDMVVNMQTFIKELASARTFGFLKDVEKLKAAGLALGGSLDNAVVVDDFSVLNEGGLRFADEFVRHKALDAIGDLALIGMPMAGHLTSIRSGHALNNELAHALLADRGAYEIVDTNPSNEDRLDISVPAYGWADAVA